MIHPEPLNKKTLLIVDDAMAPRKMLRKLLIHFGEYKAEEVSNFKDAKELLLSKQFHLILCDIHLPDGNGIELLKILRDGKLGSTNVDTPYVCFSSDLSKNEMNEAKGFGASGFLMKPFSFGDLFRVLSATFNWDTFTRKYFERLIG